MYKIALTQLWDKGGYGYCGSIPNPFGHYISQFEALNISISNIDELTQLAKSRPNLTLNIVMLYNMGDYTLCLICTSYIKILQRVWRGKYKRIQNKITKYKRIRCLYNREIYGR